MQALSLTTELEAVNIMLGTIGESPVNSLASAESTVDVATARQILRETLMAVLARGWQFNTELSWSLSPNTSGELQIPGNCLQIDSTGVSKWVDVVQRGGRLYDRVNHTYVFGGPLVVDMIILLEFTEIPQAARQYIAVRASRVFQARMLGSELLGGFTAHDEREALAALKKLDSNNADYNYLTGSYSVNRILNR